MYSMKVFVLVGMLSICVACGDENDNSPADVDAAPDDRGSIAFAVVGDSSAGTGIASTVDIESLTVRQKVVAGVVGGDAVVRLIDGKLYIINRFGGNNVTIVDATTYGLISQISTGAGSNPNDVAVRGSTIYASAADGAGVVVLDADRPQAGVISTIDLSSLDADGLPNCASMYLVGDNLLVACSLLDSEFTPTGSGKIAVIDTKKNTLTGSFDLSTKNPFGPLAATPANGPLAGDLLLGTFIFPTFTTGCIERISLSPSPSSAGCLVSNEDLGGFASAYGVAANGLLYVAVTTGYDAQGAVARVVAYDLAKSKVLAEPITSSSQRVYDFTVCPTGELVAVDALGGLRVFNSDAKELTTDLLDLGLPPINNGMVVCY